MGLFNVFPSDFLSSNLMDADGSLSENSDNKIATQKAVKTAIFSVSETVPKIYRNGSLVTTPMGYITSGVVSGGIVTFNLTNDNTPTGTPIFNNVYKESFSPWVEDSLNQYQFGGFSLSGNKKVLTVTANILGSVLLGVIQFISPANGTVVNMTVWGD